MPGLEPAHPLPPLLPAGRRWGLGCSSIRPYLRDVWATRTSNPVFTANQLVSLVWPAATGTPGTDGASCHGQ